MNLWDAFWGGFLDIANWQKPKEATDILSNLGALLAGITAFITMILFNFRSYRNQLDNQFRDFYTFFWDNGKVSRGRKIISYEFLHNDLSGLLGELNNKNEIKLNESAENAEDEAKEILKKIDQIEDVDSFFAAISRLTIHGSVVLPAKHKIIYHKIFIQYWIMYILSKPPIRDYYLTHWCMPIGEKKTYDSELDRLRKQNKFLRWCRIFLATKVSWIFGILTPPNFFVEKAIIQIDKKDNPNLYFWPKIKNFIKSFKSKIESTSSVETENTIPDENQVPNPNTSTEGKQAADLTD